MVVLSAAILSKSKTLVARQFVEMTRLRVEGLLSAFPKLVDQGKDHTYVETENVRYVYQPMENLFLLLVTNKSSNILEDLETLRLLAKVVQDCCSIQVNEENVVKNAFDIIFAFDEVISFGHRESVTLSQIKTYTEMDSHEEKLHQMIEQSKINEAKENAKKKQLELAKQRMTAGKDAKSSMPGIAGGMGSGGGGGGGSVEDQLKALQSQSGFGGGSMGGGSMGGGSDGSSLPPWSPTMGDDDGPAPVKGIMPKRGMALGKKAPAPMMNELFGPNSGPDKAADPVEEQAPPAPVVNPLMEPVSVTIDEKITANCQLEGGLIGEAECLGQFVVNVLDTAKGDLVCFKLAEQDQKFKYKVHPNLNKASHNNNILEVRDASRAFRANTPAPLLKWRYTSNKEEMLPIQLSCWPTTQADGTQVVLEYELTDDKVTLQDCHARFPCPPNAQATVTNVDNGECDYEPSTQQVHWYIPVIEKSESSGSIEFSAKTDIAMMLPFTFEATVQGSTMCPMAIESCYHQAKGEKIEYASQVSSTYSFTIGA